MNIGDKVRFLNDIGGGTISGFQKGGIVLVKDEDGFEMPVLTSEVVVITPQSEGPSPVKASPQTPPPTKKPRKEKPEEPTEEDIRIAELKEYYKQKTPVAPTAQHSVTATQVTAAPKTETVALEDRVLQLEMTIRKLQMRIERLEDARALREKIKGTSTPRHTHTPRTDEPLEIDLHATELLDTTAGMGPREIKDYQLQTVRRTMTEHQRDKGRKIVFIHGNGDGVLRKAVTDLLRREFPRCPYQDASFQQYGFGATMVTIR